MSCKKWGWISERILNITFQLLMLAFEWNLLSGIKLLKSLFSYWEGILHHIYKSLFWRITLLLFLQTLFNPNKTVVKMFVVVYDLRRMPANHQTFLRQRTFSVPVKQEMKRSISKENVQHTAQLLRYLIHLRFQSSKSGKIYLHRDVRLLFSRKSMEVDSGAAYELKSYTESPTNPQFSPRCWWGGQLKSIRSVPKPEHEHSQNGKYIKWEPAERSGPPLLSWTRFYERTLEVRPVTPKWTGSTRVFALFVLLKPLHWTVAIAKSPVRLVFTHFISVI